MDQVAKHVSEGDAWIVVDGDVYDVSKFVEEHPGGKKILLRACGTDASTLFHKFHAKSVLAQYAKLKIGSVQGAKATAKTLEQPPNSFGDLVSYGDPNWYQGWESPHFTDSHRAFRAAVRSFVDTNVKPFCDQWDEDRRIPRRLFQDTAQAGLLAGCVGTPWPTQYVGSFIAGGVKPEEYDSFHELILFDEMARCGSGGVLWALLEGLHIGLPPVLNFGSEELKQRVVGPCLQGGKIICLNITEPSAGSDVASLTTTARLNESKTHYIVNGEKKWITNGQYADFFTVAVRTGGPGAAGVSMLLIERERKGVSTRKMDCSGVWPSGTAYVLFEDVSVPVSNLIGREGEGFKIIMYNFNHERWGFVAQANRFARVCLEDAMVYAHKRKTFGKSLIDHPVIRWKLAQMTRHIEATHAWLEQVTYQMKMSSHAQTARLLAGPVALLKAQATQTFEYCAREAAQIFGGLAYTRGGQGSRVERLYREVRAYAIPGGSEEIMLDFSMRQAAKRCSEFAAL